MYDVELVLRFFAMRNIEDFDYPLSDVLDDALCALNQYDENDIKVLENLFISTLIKANSLFGVNAFRYYVNDKWSMPARMIYDPMMMVLSQQDIIVKDMNVDSNIVELRKFYESAIYKKEDGSEERIFDGKHQSKDDVLKRANAIDEFVRKLIK